MGDWRRVHITGTCDKAEVDALRERLAVGYADDGWLPVCASEGLCGLSNWAATAINEVANLGERGYDHESVAEAFHELVKVAPSLSVKIHCSGPYESAECIHTVTVENGEVSIGEPEVAEVTEIDVARIQGNLMAALMRPSADVRRLTVSPTSQHRRKPYG